MRLVITAGEKPDKLRLGISFCFAKPSREILLGILRGRYVKASHLDEKIQDSQILHLEHLKMFKIVVAVPRYAYSLLILV